jgi:glutamine---fructose-6-phosphate transaminase (isomerizing)
MRMHSPERKIMAQKSESTLRREILQQPEVLQRLLERERANVEQIAAVVRERQPTYIMVAARGTSDNAARYGQYLFGAANHLPVALATPSLHTRYEQPPTIGNALVIGISQSGQTPDILRVVEDARTQGALTLSITNTAGSPLADAADHVILMNAGEEVSVGATKTYTASLMALAMLSAALSEDATRFDELAQVADYVAEVTGAADAIVRSAERYRYMDACVVLSRGYNYATAFEIALKLKELTYILAEPYSSADFQHGPVAIVERGFPVIAVVPEGAVAGEVLDLLRQLHERKAELLIASALDEALELAHSPIALPRGMPEWISPMVLVVPGQLLAYGLALAKGLDPDHPRELSKVTITH